jgi:hypothetical protein
MSEIPAREIRVINHAVRRQRDAPRACSRCRQSVFADSHRIWVNTPSLLVPVWQVALLSQPRASQLGESLHHRLIDLHAAEVETVHAAPLDDILARAMEAG